MWQVEGCLYSWAGDGDEAIAGESEHNQYDDFLPLSQSSSISVTDKGFAYIVERGGGDGAIAGEIKKNSALLISFHAPEYKYDKRS